MDKTKKILFLVSLYTVPVLLLFFGVLDYSRRYWVLAIVALILITYSILGNFKLDDLGFKISYPKKEIVLNTIFCSVVILLLILLYKVNLIREPTIPDWNMFFIFYVLISSPLQEFLFRSLVFHELKLLGCTKLEQILISAINFGFMHIIYHDLITFISAVLVGLCFGYIYSETKSIYGISLTHAVIGAVSIYVGLV